MGVQKSRRKRGIGGRQRKKCRRKKRKKKKVVPVIVNWLSIDREPIPL